MNAAFLKFWGVRGSIPSPGPETVFYGGNTSCVEVRAGGQIIILDAGTGIRGLGQSLLREFGEQPINVSLLITHTHWDHIQGFPFFQPAYNARNSIAIYGFEGAKQGLQSALSVQMDSPYFPVNLYKMPGKIKVHELKDVHFKVGQIPVLAHVLNHPGTCTGFRILTAAGAICYLPDVELFPMHMAKSQPGFDQEQLAQHDQNQSVIDFINGAEVLIMDSQYNPAEYRSHTGWGHSCVQDVVSVAVRGGVKRIFLFHHDPDHTDGDIRHLLELARQIARAMHSPIQIEAAREGLELQLTAMKSPAGTPD